MVCSSDSFRDYDGDTAAVGRLGDSCDNALTETIIGLFKTGVLRKRGPSRHVDQIGYATLVWVAGFRNRRLVGPIGDMPSADKGAAQRGVLEEQAEPA